MNAPQTPDNEVALPSDKSSLQAQSDPLALYHALCDMTKDLIEKTNEVARLREVCEWAADMMDGISPARGQEIRDAIARLAPAPEEPETSAQIDKCIGNVTEPANPTCSNTTHKFSHCDCENPTPIALEWRELGPDEVIQDGDEYISKQKAVWYEIDDEFENTMVKQWPTHDWPYYQFRTRRPLPKPTPYCSRCKKNHDFPCERPLEDGPLDQFQYHLMLCEDAGESDDLLQCLRALRDEIQKLKQK